MRIGIIGAGRIGATAARLFAGAGHEVAIANSRGPESLRELEQELGPRVRAATVDEAGEFGQVVLLAVPWPRRDGLPDAERLAGRIVVDALNPYGPGGIVDLGDSTSSEEVAKQLPGARMVKAFNTIHFEHLGRRGRPAGDPERIVIFLAGDDAAAKETVAGLIDEIGFDPVDTGSLREGGRRQQPGSDIYNEPMSAERARELLNRG